MIYKTIKQMVSTYSIGVKYTIDDVKTLCVEYKNDYANSTALDTETTGLNIGENGDKAFAIAWAWWGFDNNKQIIKKSYFIDLVDHREEKINLILESVKSTKNIWGFNIKFDINILRNSNDINIYEYNWKDVLILWRLTRFVDEPSQRTGLKELASEYICEESMYYKDQVKIELSHLNAEHTKNFVNYCKDLGIKISAIEVAKLKKGDIFINDDIYTTYFNWLKNNPLPNYLDIYKQNPKMFIKYTILDGIYTMETANYFYKLFKPMEMNRLFKLECDLIPAIANQERNGILVDLAYLNKSKEKVKEYYNYVVNELESLVLESKKYALKDLNETNDYYKAVELYAYRNRKMNGKQVQLGIDLAQKKIDDFKNIWYSDNTININSSEKITIFMFTAFGISNQSWNKIAFMNQLDIFKSIIKDDLPENLKKIYTIGGRFIELLLIYRRVSKWASTYIGRWINECNQLGTTRLHPSFNPYKTTTGRFSSSFQQQPKDNLYDIRNPDEKVELFSPREMVLADKTNDYIGVAVFDLSQIEVRVNAHYTYVAGLPDSTLIESLLHGVDMHKRTAAQAFHPKEFAIDITQAEELVTSKERSSAKSLNFLMQYGGGVGAIKAHPDLSKLDVNVQDKLYEVYQEQRKGTIHYQQWAMNSIKEQYDEINKRHYVSNIYGRKYWATSMWANEQSYKVINYYIQGTCADALKTSLVAIDNYLYKNNLKSKIILNVHDEVQVQLHKDEVYIINEIKKFMEYMPWSIYIPIICDIEFYDKSWNDKYEIQVIDNQIIRKEDK